MDMRTITNEIIEDIDEVKKILVGQMCTEDMLMCMDEKTLKAVQVSLKCIDDASDLMREYVNVLEEQNEKLDMILRNLKENRA